MTAWHCAGLARFRIFRTFKNRIGGKRNRVALVVARGRRLGGNETIARARGMDEVCIRLSPAARLHLVNPSDPPGVTSIPWKRFLMCVEEGGVATPEKFGALLSKFSVRSATWRVIAKPNGEIDLQRWSDFC